MKKIILVAIMAIITLCANAQLKIESPHPDLMIEVKRAVMTNRTCIIDLLITNLGDDDKIFFTTAIMGNESRESFAYDDEGNQYRYTMGLASDLSYMTSINFPQEVPVKFRMQIEKVDPNASAFKMIKLALQSEGPLKLNLDNPIIFRNLELSK